MYDNIQANIFPLHTYLTTEWGQKVKTFFLLKMDMLYIKSKGNMQAII